MEVDLHLWLRQRLTRKRYDHSLAVSERAGFLAGLNGINREKAELAGLLHDYCHCMPPDEQLKIIKSRGILLDDFELAQPKLWHAVSGSVVIADELHVKDPEIISAVRFHTTGRADMTVFEQVVYLADLTSADRDYPGVGADRKLSQKSLAECMMKNLSHTISTLAKQQSPIVRDAWEAYNYFWNTIKKGDSYDFD